MLILAQKCRIFASWQEFAGLFLKIWAVLAKFAWTTGSLQKAFYFAMQGCSPLMSIELAVFCLAVTGTFGYPS